MDRHGSRERGTRGSGEGPRAGDGSHRDGARRADARDGDATDCADAAIKAQRRVERNYRSAMSALLDVSELREVIGRQEAYRRMSRLGDRVHRVAQRVWYAVVKEA